MPVKGQPFPVGSQQAARRRSDADGGLPTVNRGQPTFQGISAGPAASAVDGDGGWRETPMMLIAPGTDRWIGAFEVDAIGWHEYQIFAWVDRFRSWRRDLQIKVAAGQDVAVELLE